MRRFICVCTKPLLCRKFPINRRFKVHSHTYVTSSCKPNWALSEYKGTCLPQYSHDRALQFLPAASFFVFCSQLCSSLACQHVPLSYRPDRIALYIKNSKTQNIKRFKSTFFINPTDAHNYKITGMLKQLNTHNRSDMFRFTQEPSSGSYFVLS